MMSHGCYGVNNSLNDVMFHVADVRVCDDITESFYSFGTTKVTKTVKS